MQNVLNWCTKLGIDAVPARQSVLLASVKAQSNESVLFFLCARDYIYDASDLKWTGIDTLFLRERSPYEINIPEGTRVQIQTTVNNPALRVSTETGAAHAVGAFVPGAAPGVQAGGTGNYNLCTKALGLAVDGFGGAFLNDMVKAVKKKEAGEASAVSPAVVTRCMQDMRNATRRFWMANLMQIGL